MITKIIIAGSGGQGIMLLGKVLAYAAMHENKFVTWLPAYGAEVRGGSAHCSVVISDEPIGSPYVDHADTLVILNAPSLLKFFHRLKKGGLLIANSSLTSTPAIKGFKSLSLPFTEKAINLGNIKTANIVALGALIGHTGILKPKTALEAIAKIAPPGNTALIEINQQALNEGLSMARGMKK